jgi:hypothetical protein
VPGDAHRGSKVWKAPDREIGKPGENLGKVIAHWDFQPAAAFYYQENRRHLGSRQRAANVQPILSTKSYRTLAKLAPPQAAVHKLSHQLLNFRTGTSLGR